jgi:hypothetical protein
VDGGSTYFTATPHDTSDPVTGLTSSPTGKAHVFRWDFGSTETGAPELSLVDDQYDNVIIRITPSDIDGSGESVSSNPFIIGNEAAYAAITAPSGTATLDSSVIVEYLLYDSSSDFADILLEYSDDGGTTFSPATVLAGEISSLTASPSGDTHSVIWDSVADIGYSSTGSVQLRIIASDPEDGVYDTAPAATGNLNVSNEGDLPYVAVGSIERLQYSPAVIPFTVFDSSSDPVTAVIEYSIDNELTWDPVVQETGMEISLAGLASSPTGTAYQVQWDLSAVLADPGQPFGDCFVRIQISDAGGLSNVAVTDRFYIGNDAPAVDVVDLSGAVRYNGNIVVEFILTDT